MNMYPNISNISLPYNVVVIIALVVDLSLGSLVSFLMRPNIKDYQIEYISQEEILTLERERAKSTKASDLFFGKSAEAIERIEELVKIRENKGARVVFSTEGIISGLNVVSISKEVYSSVIQKLEQESPTVDSAPTENSQNNREINQIRDLSKKNTSRQVRQIMDSLNKSRADLGQDEVEELRDETTR